MNPCTLGKRHKWNWHSTVERRSMGYNTIRITRLSKYVCECGEIKLGSLDPNTSKYEQEKQQAKNKP